MMGIVHIFADNYVKLVSAIFYKYTQQLCYWMKVNLSTENTETLYELQIKQLITQFKAPVDYNLHYLH